MTTEDPTDAFVAGARDEWQRPREVIERLQLSGDERVIDLGAGTGYFTRLLAPLARRLIAVEPEPALRARLLRRGFEAVAALPEETVDLIFAANVLRFLRPAELDRIAGLTRRVVLIDWKSGRRPVGPPEAEALSPVQAIRAFPRFRSVPAGDFLPYQWMLELERVD